MQIGDRVVTPDGDTGEIVKVDEMTGWYHVHLDKHDSAAYRDHHDGPYTKRELKRERA